MRRNLLVLTVLLSYVLSSASLAATDNDKERDKAVTITAAEKKMAETITADRLKDYLSFVASDAMGGRNTPSPGLDITAQFIALKLKHWGFKPAGDNGSFFQKMTVKLGTPDKTKTVLRIGGKSFAFGKHFVRVAGESFAESPIVFGGNGWLVKSKGIDAFAGVDVRDKIVVLYGAKSGRDFLPVRPKSVTREDLKGEKGVDWADPATHAYEKGAKAIIVVANPEWERGWSSFRSFFSAVTSIEGLNDGSEASAIPKLLVASSVATAIFDGSSLDHNSDKAFDTKGSGSFEFVNAVERTPTQNVIALWEGSDPTLKEEMVAVGAHYDHVGTRQETKGEDKIWNGADDDGSGTVAVLSIAEALARAPKRPKRSVLLVWHTGEEKGLVGSAYFNKYPTVDIKKVVAQLNMDMIGRSKKEGDTNKRNKDLTGSNEVYVIGSDLMSSKLSEVTKGINSSYLKLKYNYKYDDPKVENRFFFRSDHYNYAINGIPVVLWFTGLHADYHGPGDEVEKIDFQKLESISRTIFLTLWKLAELQKRPAVDKDLPPELRVRN